MNPSDRPNPELSASDDEASINGIPHRLLDGYDGDGKTPTADAMAQLLATAPPQILARIAEFAE
jgi:hypothetical protein